MPATFPFLFTMQLLSSSLHCSTVGGRGRKKGKKGVTPGVSLDTQLCAPPLTLPPKKPFFSSFPPSVGSLVKSENSFSEKPNKKKKKRAVIIIKKISPHTWVSRIFDQKRKAKILLFIIRSGARRESGVRVLKYTWGPKMGILKKGNFHLRVGKREKRVLGRKYQMYSGFRTGVITPPPFPNLIHAKKGE